MRAVAFTIIFFIYMFSVSAYLIDEVLLQHTTLTPLGLDGTPLNPSNLINDGIAFQNIGDETLNPSQSGTIYDRISQYLLTTYAVTWNMLDLLSGTYAFNLLYTIVGAPALVVAIKVMFPMFVAFQVIWFLVGRY